MHPRTFMMLVSCRSVLSRLAGLGIRRLGHEVFKARCHKLERHIRRQQTWLGDIRGQRASGKIVDQGIRELFDYPVHIAVR